MSKEVQRQERKREKIFGADTKKKKVQPKFRDDRGGEDLLCGHYRVTYS